MGIVCAFCSKNESVGQIQPDTQSVVGKRSEVSSLLTDATSLITDRESIRSESTERRYMGPTSECTETTNRTITEQDLKENLIEEFYNAITNGTEDMVAFYVEENPEDNLLDIRYNQETWLHLAVRHQQYKIIQYLLEQHLSPNAQNGFTGDTPLHLASRHGDLKAVELLCDKQYKIDKTIQNEEEDTAMDIAIEKDSRDHRNIARFLEPNTKKLLKIKAHASFRKYGADDILSSSPGLLQISKSHESWGGKKNAQSGNHHVVNGYSHDLKQTSVKPMQSWMERKQAKPPYSWLKRWVVIHDQSNAMGYLLWSEREITVGKNGVDRKEKKRWNKCINLTQITKVEAITVGKTQRKFTININKKQYLFRAKTKEIRNEWVQILRQNVDFLKASNLYSAQIISPSVSHMSYFSE